MHMNLKQILKELSRERPIFHSEGDFQFSLSYKIRESYPVLNVRNEFPIKISNKSRKIDIAIFDNSKNAILIELKYKPTEIFYRSDIEKYQLKKLIKIEYGYYGFIKDIYRLETFGNNEELKQEYDLNESYALILTNDERFWRLSKTTAKYKDFLLYEGRELSGDFNYNKKVKNKIFMDSFQLSNSYSCFWQDYSQINNISKNCNFRYLLIRVQ